MDATARPSAWCTLDVMAACEAHWPDAPGARAACVHGARDAHLRDAPAPPPDPVRTPGLAEAYRSGWNGAVLSCPVQVEHRGGWA